MVDYYLINTPEGMANADLIKGTPAPRLCGGCKRIVDGSYHKSVKAKLLDGRRPADFILILDSTIGVSDKAKSAIEGASLTGVGFGDLTIGGARAGRGYHLMFPTASAATWPEGALRSERKCRSCNRWIPIEVPDCFTRGQAVDESSIASDLFAAANFPYMLYFTKRLAEVCQAAGLRGLEFSDPRVHTDFYDMEPDITLK
jgi:hypothetical protein